jgi:hypothetical protein
MTNRVRKIVRGRTFEYELSNKEPHTFAIDTENTGALYVFIKGKSQLINDDLKSSELDKAIDDYCTKQDEITAKNKTKKEKNFKIFDKFKTEGWSGR